jgi:hypothetical protein
MAIFRTLFLAVLLVLSTHALSAQTTREVRATPAAGQYATVAAAVLGRDGHGRGVGAVPANGRG